MMPDEDPTKGSTHSWMFQGAVEQHEGSHGNLQENLGVSSSNMTSNNEYHRHHDIDRSTKDDDDDYDDVDDDADSTFSPRSPLIRRMDSSGSTCSSSVTISGQRQHIIRRKWTSEEDNMLRRAVEIHNGAHWKRIAEMVPGRSHVQCLQRWRKSLHPSVVKGRWTKQEDEMLLEIVRKNPHIKNWGYAARYIPGRTAKQCRERYTNHLSPDIKKGQWTEEEDRFIMESHKRLGNKWAEIASHLPGRTENAIKIRLKGLKKKMKTKEDQMPSSTSTSPPFVPPEEPRHQTAGEVKQEPFHNDDRHDDMVAPLLIPNPSDENLETTTTTSERMINLLTNLLPSPYGSSGPSFAESSLNLDPPLMSPISLTSEKSFFPQEYHQHGHQIHHHHRHHMQELQHQHQQHHQLDQNQHHHHHHHHHHHVEHHQQQVNQLDTTTTIYSSHPESTVSTPSMEQNRKLQMDDLINTDLLNQLE